ncbi:hypothetical protein [Paenarthrobacter nitroguajacolicus]|uniref:hypothetical protein n=1 Tax=Paenarthrobacter nitroguajacolicus TaxID=211146 RepID=UPI00248ACAA1|nr:hypothetical protein [Paenarthrobacter nitroguajacolicus]MDI2034911.1 hypothetical protein [Paenarthrobacter nitroguajacolicus]
MTAVLVAGKKDASLPGPATEMPEPGSLLGPDPAQGSTPSKRTGLLDVVWTAAARVEGLQWEMDEAEDCLVQAMRSAVAAGAALPDLAIASGLGFAAIERLIEEPSPLLESLSKS